MINFDELMNDYSVNAEFRTGEIPLSPEEKERILQRTLAQMKPTKIPRRKRRSRALLIACILILAAFTLSFAAYQYAVSDNALNFFGSMGEKERNALNEASTAVDKSVSQGGITIHVKEIIGDRHTAYILFDVIAPQEAALDKGQYMFKTSRVLFSSPLHEDTSGSMGWNITDLPDEAPGDNIKPMILAMDVRKDIAGKMIKLHLEDFSYYNPNYSPKSEVDDSTLLVAGGSWDISFEMNYKDSSNEYRVNQRIKYNGYNIKAKTLTLSPISASITARGFDLGTKRPENENDQDNFSIHLKDGTVIDRFKSTGQSSGSGKLVINYSFEDILDPADVDHVYFNGIEINVNQLK